MWAIVNMTCLSSASLSLSLSLFIKRNANAFSLNAIVDVRLLRRPRCHEMIFFNISKTIRASDFKIYLIVPLNSFHILTGNDVTIYFWLAANCTNVSIFGSSFLIMVQSISKMFTVLKIVIQVLRLLLCNL